MIVDDQRLKEHSAHWEAGAKQNFDTGLYTAYTVLYIRVSDYGPKPKVGKAPCSGQGDKSATVVHHPQLRGGGGRVPHFHGKDAAMSRVTYDAGNLTIEVDGLDTVATALGDLKKKDPGGGKGSYQRHGTAGPQADDPQRQRHGTP